MPALTLPNRRRSLTRTVLVLATLTGLPLGAATLRVPQEHATIQAAIDAARPGDTVLVSPGTYRERLRLIEGVIVRSAGDDAAGQRGLRRAELTIIDGGGEVAPSGARPGVIMAEGAVLDGFTVTRVGRFDEALWKRHHETRGEEQSRERMRATRNPGILVEAVSCEVRNNRVHDNGDTGIAILGFPGTICSPRVERNTVFRNLGSGIASRRGSTATIEANECFENFYAGIGHSGASPRVSGNVCHGNVRAGIGISEGARPLVTGNRCHGNRRSGIGIRTGSRTRPVIEGNICHDNEMAGIGVREGASPVVRGNRCFRNMRAGIGVRDGASPLIIGNECFENELSGIGQRGNARTTIIGNHLHHNRKAGIGYAECENGVSSVINNRIIDNEAVAIGIHRGWDVRVTDNLLVRPSGLPPVVMVFEGARAHLDGNRLRGDGVAGVRVAGELRATRNRFEGTEIRRGGPPNFAVWALPGSRVAVVGNRMSRWRHALHASAARVTVTGNDIRDFHRVAIVIQKPTLAAVVESNRIFTSREGDRAVTVDGVTAFDDENTLSPAHGEE